MILFVTDPRDSEIKNPSILKKLQKSKVAKLLIINKIDLIDQEELETLSKTWQEILPEAEILQVSALKNKNLPALFDKLLSLLPEGAPYYPPDQLTDKTERFFVSEMIREKILLFYKQEIPYAVQVEVESFKEEESIIRIATRIYVGRDSQKGILIGHKGNMLKKVGTEARKDMETFFGKKVFLELFVKVRKDWKDNDLQLKQWGYN